MFLSSFFHAWAAYLLISFARKGMCEASSKLPVHCSPECSHNNIITPPSPLDLLLQVKETTAEVVSFPPTVKVVVLKVRRYVEICPDGFALYSMNEKCNSSTRTIEIPLSLLKEIHTGVKCPIGADCRPDSSECDSWGSIHCTEKPDLKLLAGNRGFSYNTIHRRNKFTYSCVQDWECMVEAQDAPIEIGSSKEGMIHAYLFTPNGLPFKLNTDTYSMMTQADGFSVVAPPIPLERSEAITVKCITADKRKMCISTSRGKVPKGTVFKVQEDGIGVSRNHLIKVGPDPNVESDQSNQVLGDKASLLQVKEVLNEVLYGQLQSLHNTLEIAGATNTVQGILTKIVEELSRNNPLLLGRISGLPIATIWNGVRKFSMCKCNHLKFDGLCAGNLYVDGITIRPRTTSDDCYPLHVPRNTSTKKFKLFSNMSLDMTLLSDIQFIPGLKPLSTNQDSFESTVNSDFFSQNQGWWAKIQQALDSIWTYMQSAATIMSWITFSSYFVNWFKVPPGR